MITREEARQIAINRLKTLQDEETGGLVIIEDAICVAVPHFIETNYCGKSFVNSEKVSQ